MDLPIASVHGLNVLKDQNGLYRLEREGVGPVQLLDDWATLVALVVEVVISFDDGLQAARKALLPEELRNFREWIVAVGRPASEEKDQRWNKLCDRFTPDYEAGSEVIHERIATERIELICAGSGTVEFRPRTSEQAVKFSAQDLIRIGCMVLSDKRTYDRCRLQFSPFLAAVLESSAASSSATPEAPAIARIMTDVPARDSLDSAFDALLKRHGLAPTESSPF